MTYEFLIKVRKEGLVAVEADIEKPKESKIFQKYPEFLKDHHAEAFVCDTLRMTLTGGVDHRLHQLELSTDWANSARRLLQQNGIEDRRISQVRGFADQMPRVPADPLDAANRRVTLIVQWANPAEGPRLRELGRRPEMSRTRGEGEGAAGTPKERGQAAVGAPAGGTALGAGAASGTGAAPAPDVAKPAPAADPPAKPSAAIARPGMLDRVKQMLPGKKQ
ncbi:MAG TPA: hypothetical protein VNW54_13255 [Granulicella sp.]|nr:hypothetical protein [Granulicella sp.]